MKLDLRALFKELIFNTEKISYMDIDLTAKVKDNIQTVMDEYCDMDGTIYRLTIIKKVKK